MKLLRIVICIVTLTALPTLASQIQLINAENLKIVSHDGVSFAQEFELPESTNIEIRIPNTDLLATSNIQISTPGGNVISASNADLHNATYYQHFPTNEHEQAYGLVDSWIITLNQVSPGKHIITGNISGNTDLPIHVTVLDSITKYSLLLGEDGRGVVTNRPIPILFFLAQDSGKYSDGVVELKIKKDDVVIQAETVRDDGQAYDPVASDGLYTTFFTAQEAGIYELEASISNIDDSNPLFTSNLVTNFGVSTPLIVIDSNYTEELIDEDSDGYTDELVLNFPILESNVTDGYFSTYGLIQTSSGEVLDDLRRIEISENRIYVKFKGDELRALEYSGSYSFEKFILKHVDDLVVMHEGLRSTASYSRDTWERENLLYADNFTDEPIDLNEDGFYDQIKVTFDVDSIVAGEFGLSTQATSLLNAKTKVFGIPSLSFNEGLNTVELIISSQDFVALGEDTSLNFRDLFVYPLFSVDALLEEPDVGTTQVYECWYFAGCTNGPNIPPVAVDDTALTDGRPININAASNDIDEDGDLIKVNAVSQPLNGNAVIIGNYIEYTPNEAFEGQESFEYEIIDVHPDNNVWKRGKDTGLITVTVTRNSPPVANDDSYSVAVDGEAQLPVLNNDTDVDGDNLYITEVTTPANGTITNYGNILVYKPNSGYSGADSFEYTIVDVDVDSNVAKGGTDTATVTLNVGAIINHSPIAVDDTFDVYIGDSATLDVVANDYDEDGDAVYIIQYSVPTMGAIEAVDNKFTYTPYSDATGQDSFNYKISDTKGGESTASVTINLLEENSAPVASDDNVTTEKNVSVDIDILTNDYDPNGDSISVLSFTQATNGSVSQVSNILTYQPDQDFIGSDSFTYTVGDGKGLTSTATVYVNVLEGTPENNSPIANDDTGSTNEGQSVIVDVLLNDSDPDGDSLTIESFTQGANGQVSEVSSGLQYIPDSGFVGEDTFSYAVHDGNGGSSTASVFITVSSQNQSPVASEDHVETKVNTAISIDVLANDYDPNGDDLQIVSTSNPQNGTAEIIGLNIVYTPIESFIGNDSFEYSISDGNGEADSSTVFISVTSDNQPPVAVDDNINIFASDTITIDVLENDSDPNGDILTIVNVESVDFGDTSIVNNKVLLTAYEEYVGDYSFSYTITDGEFEVVATVAVSISEQSNNAPIVTINEPLNGAEFIVGEDITFNAVASDSEDGNLSASINWISQIDGVLGVGGEISARLSEGSHTISVTVTDSDNNAGTEEINIIVRNLPVNEFVNNNSHNIPDNKGYGVVSSISIPVELDPSKVRVYANIEHGNLDDIAVQLISPGGKRYNLSNPGQYTSGKSWTISVQNATTEGVWALKVSDQKKDTVGILKSWRISFE